MGAVHGVMLKYVALCAASVSGARALGPADPDDGWTCHRVCSLLLWYSALTHLLISLFFMTCRGQWVIGKSAVTGQVPLWSLVVWAAFHLPTWLYTLVHTELGDKGGGVPVASEVAPGWWLGGRYGYRLGRRWACTVDLTTEFPEGCIAHTAEYLLLACWDGQPPPPRDIERAAVLCAAQRADGDIMVHCAHGRGRSTCVMVACLVRAGLHATWRDAFEAIKPRRPGIKLNGQMRRALDAWEAAYQPKKTA